MRTEHAPSYSERITRTTTLVLRFFVFLLKLFFFVFWTTLRAFPAIAWMLVTLTLAFLAVRTLVFDADLLTLGIEAILFAAASFIVIVPSYFTLWLLFSPKQKPAGPSFRARAA